MISMTGYGKAVSNSQTREIVVELKSVNHRFLDISTKMPRSFIAFDSLIKETIGNFVSRGHVDVFINYTVSGDAKKKVAVDLDLAQNYLDVAKQLENAFNLKNDFGLVHLMRTNDVIVVEEQEEDTEEIATLLKSALTNACQNLNVMRKAEGDRLEKVISTHVDNIEGFANLFDIIGQYETGFRFSEAERIFGACYQGSTEGFPADNSLRRNMIEYMNSGEQSGHGIGIILYDGKKKKIL